MARRDLCAERSLEGVRTPITAAVVRGNLRQSSLPARRGGKGGNFPLVPMWGSARFARMRTVVKDSRFELISEILKPDAKKRLTLGQAVAEAGVAYNVYRNRLGQIILDPVKAVPAYETWLYENKPALAAVKRGLADSAAGRTKSRGSFAAHAKED